MPNWCSNSLTLTAASVKEADELYRHLKKDELDEGWTFFGFFVPEDWDEDNWYWSRVEAWGTKWDAHIIDVNWVSDTDVCLTFDTAWGPPIGVYEAAVEQGWGVHATYYEPGMGFVGSFIDGDDEYYEYHSCQTVEEIRDHIPDDLDEEYGISDWMQQMIDEEEEENRMDGGRENFG